MAAIGDACSAYKDFLTKYPWEWFTTICLPSRNHTRYLTEIRTAILREEHGQIAMMGVFSSNGGPHTHLLMLGRFYRPGTPRTLHDIDGGLWEERINEIVRDKRGCVIKSIKSNDDLQRIAAYMVNPKNAPGMEMLLPWGRILKKIK